ncbi:hypothetical protein ILYODFUR_026568, partial [Ilyodon furcidens]
NPSYRAAVRLLGLGVASQAAGNSTSQVLLKYQNSASSADMEQTFIAVKPDGVQRGLCGEIIKRFEHRGFKLVAAKFLQASEDHMKKHYLDLKDMPFYAGLCKYMSSGPVFAMVTQTETMLPSLQTAFFRCVSNLFTPAGLQGLSCFNPIKPSAGSSAQSQRTPRTLFLQPP